MHLLWYGSTSFLHRACALIHFVVPGLLVLIGGLSLPDSPASLLERGRDLEALATLKRLRKKNTNVNYEMNEIVKAKEAVVTVADNPWKTLLAVRRYKPQLICCLLLPA